MIQVFGLRKCRDTQKALRFFKERGTLVQFRDIGEKPPSPGEMEDIARSVGGFDSLIDADGTAAGNRGLSYMAYDAREELERHPELFRTPIVRAGKGKAVVGVDEKMWKLFAAI